MDRRIQNDIEVKIIELTVTINKPIINGTENSSKNRSNSM